MIVQDNVMLTESNGLAGFILNNRFISDVLNDFEFKIKHWTRYINMTLTSKYFCPRGNIWHLCRQKQMCLIVHYENTPIQIYWKFYNQKQENFQKKNSDIFHISAQNIDCGYALEPPRWGGSNENPQSMFFSNIRKIKYTPVNPSFTI